MDVNGVRICQGRHPWEWPSITRTVENHQAKQHSGNCVTRQLQVGLPVKAREYGKDQKCRLGVVNARNVLLSYLAVVALDNIWKRHVDQIRNSHMLTTLEFPSTSANPPDVSAAPTNIEMTPNFGSPIKQLKHLRITI